MLLWHIIYESTTHVNLYYKIIKLWPHLPLHKWSLCHWAKMQLPHRSLCGGIAKWWWAPSAHGIVEFKLSQKARRWVSWWGMLIVSATASHPLSLIFSMQGVGGGARSADSRSRCESSQRPAPKTHTAAGASRKTINLEPLNWFANISLLAHSSDFKILILSVRVMRNLHKGRLWTNILRRSCEQNQNTIQGEPYFAYARCGKLEGNPFTFLKLLNNLFIFLWKKFLWRAASLSLSACARSAHQAERQQKNGRTRKEASNNRHMTHSR
jgi:hypothetical protein